MLINICLIVVIILSSMVLACYNKFIRLSNEIDESTADIDVLLNQRFDLIPNLVETVKGYTKHENTTFENVTKLRGTYNTDNGFNVSEAENADKQINKLVAIAENYPELKANTQFLSLQESLSNIEDKLIIARTKYNKIVTKYNNHVETIPSNLIAKIFNFEAKDLFKIDDEKRENIKIDLSE